MPSEFRLIVERGHHHMPALPPFGVIAVMADDETRDAVIPRVNSRHKTRVKRAVSLAFRYQRPGSDKDH
jgi:hypothetical protein